MFSRTHRVPLDWLFDRTNLDSINPNQIHWHQEPTRRHTDKGKFHTWWMESSFVFVQHRPFQFHWQSWSHVEKNTRRCRWRRVTAKSKPMMNLVSRYHVRDPNVFASTASESPVKTKSESQNVPLSSFNVQQKSTEKPVLGASSSNYSEWNIDDKWSSQEWKSGEMSNTSTERPVYDKFVIDDDMDSDTVTESNLSLRSRSFLNRVNDRLRKMLDRSPEDSMQDIDKRSMISWMFMSSTLEASVFMGKDYSDNLHSINNTGKISF